MRLACLLGWHWPHDLPHWRNGFYIARCAGCGRPLRRIGRERWSVVPAGSSARPARSPEAAAPSPEAGGDGRDHGEAERPPAPPPLAAIPVLVGDTAPTERQRAEHRAAEDANPGARGSEQRLPEELAALDAADGATPAEPGAPDERAARPIAARTGAPRGSEPPVVPGAREERGRTRRRDATLVWLGAAIAGVGTFAGAAIVLLLLTTVGVRLLQTGHGGQTEAAARPPAPPAPAMQGQADVETTQAAAVPAIHCRRERVRHSRRSREEIRFTSRDGSWIAVSQPGTRCWNVRAGGKGTMAR